jgi:hypothetical protein
MEPPDLSCADAGLLADLLWSGGDEERLWESEELGAIFEHQLAAEIEFDLGRSQEALGRDIPQLLRSVEGPPIRSFRDLFEHPRPPIELLDLTRQFAKTCRLRGDGPLPVEIATVLYVTAIVAAMVKAGQRITKLDDQALCYSLDWALDQPWLDESIRGLLRRGRQVVGLSEADRDA